jgi:hypothetical protein
MNDVDYFIELSASLYSKLGMVWNDIKYLENELLSHHSEATLATSTTLHPQLVLRVIQQQYIKFNELCQHIAIVHKQCDDIREQFLRSFNIRGTAAENPFPELESEHVKIPKEPKLSWNPQAPPPHSTQPTTTATTTGSLFTSTPATTSTSSSSNSSSAGFGFGTTTSSGFPHTSGGAATAPSSTFGATGFGATTMSAPSAFGTSTETNLASATGFGGSTAPGGAFSMAPQPNRPKATAKKGARRAR